MLWRSALVVTLALASGCGDGGGSGSHATPTATIAFTAVATATPSATATVSATATEVPTARPTATATDTSTPIPTPTDTPIDESSLPAFAGSGPYQVGVTTLNIGDRDIEVWYPIDPGSEAGATKASYAAFEVLPEAIQQLLPPDLNLVVTMNAYRDLPVSQAGPFPILTFSHGAGGFRHAYSAFLTGIASWGFVTASLDHLEWGLLAQVGLLPPGINRDPGEVVLAAVDRLAQASADDSSPLAGGVDATRVATAGHSAGGRAAFALPDRAEIKAMLGYATGASSSGVAGKPILLLVGEEDGGAEGLEQAYEDLSPVKRFVSIGRAGHNSFTDQCAIIHGGNNFLVRLVEAGFPIPPALLEQALDGCRPENLPPADFWPVAQHFTVAHSRAALALDDPQVGLGPGVANAFGPVALRYRRNEDVGTSPPEVQGFVVSGFAAIAQRTPAMRVRAASTWDQSNDKSRGCRHWPTTAPTRKRIRTPTSSRSRRPAHSTDWTSMESSPRGMHRATPLRARRLRRSRGRAGPRPPDVARRRVYPRLPAGGDHRHRRRPGRARRIDDHPDRGARPRRLATGRLGARAGVRQHRRAAGRRRRQGAALRHPERAPRPPLSQPGRQRPHRRRGARRRPDGHPRAAQHPDRRRRPDVPRRLGAFDAAARRHGPGQLFGFQPLEEFYDIFGRKAGQAGAAALGYTCSGFHAVLASQADGDYDAATGECTSLSTGYTLAAVPAFVAR